MIKAHWLSCFGPPDRRPIWEWAATELEMPAILAGEKRFDIQSRRHFVKPLQWIQDDSIREVVLLAHPRSGKTLMIDICVPWIVDNDPGPVLCVFHDEDVCREHIEGRSWPILKSCARIVSMMPAERNKERVSELIFPHMPVYFKGPALRKLQAKGIRWLFRDEAWCWKRGMLGESRGRVGDFEKIGISKIVTISQGGGEMHNPDWPTECDRAEFNEWTVPCEQCGKKFAPRWTGERSDGSRWGMRWKEEKDARGFWIPNRCLPSVAYHCPHCDHGHIDSHRVKRFWNNGGEYVVTGEPNAKKKLASFNAIIDQPWENLVEEWLVSCNAEKKGDTTLKVIFWQKRMAQHKSPVTLDFEEHAFRRAVYEVKDKWPEERARFMCCDKQAEGLYYVTIFGWAQHGETRRLYRGKLFGEAALVEKQKEFNVPPVWVAVDSGYEAKGDNGVYAMCIRNGWTALHGDDPDNGMFWHTIGKGGPNPKRVRKYYSPPITVDPGEGTAKQGRVRADCLILFSSSVMSERVHGLIKRGLWVEPAGAASDPDEVDYRKQMASEYKSAKTGKWMHRGDNHYFDCAKMNCAMATMIRILPEEIEKEEGRDMPVEEPRGEC